VVKQVQSLSEKTLKRIVDYRLIARSCSIKPEAVELWVQNVRAYIDAHDVTQKDLASEIGISAEWLCYILAGTPSRTPSLEMQVKVAVGLSISPPDDVYLPHSAFLRKYC